MHDVIAIPLEMDALSPIRPAKTLVLSGPVLIGWLPLTTRPELDSSHRGALGQGVVPSDHPLLERLKLIGQGGRGAGGGVVVDCGPRDRKADQWEVAGSRKDLAPDCVGKKGAGERCHWSVLPSGLGGRRAGRQL